MFSAFKLKSALKLLNSVVSAFIFAYEALNVSKLNKLADADPYIPLVSLFDNGSAKTN